MKKQPTILTKFMQSNFKTINQHEIYSKVQVSRERILHLYKQSQQSQIVANNLSFLAVLTKTQDTIKDKSQGRKQTSQINMKKIEQNEVQSEDSDEQKSQWQILKILTQSTNEGTDSDMKQQNSRSFEYRRNLSNSNTPVNSLLKLQYDSFLQQK